MRINRNYPAFGMGQDGSSGRSSEQGAAEMKDLDQGDGAVTPQQYRHISEGELTA